MSYTKIRDSKLFLVGIPLFLMFSVVLFSFTKTFKLYGSHLANAAILDLVLTIPLIYFMLITISKLDNKTSFGAINKIIKTNEISTTSNLSNEKTENKFELNAEYSTIIIK